MTGAERIVAALEAAGIQDIDLDDVVDDVASLIRSNVNNGGIERQVEWLLEHGGSEGILVVLNEKTEVGPLFRVFPDYWEAAAGPEPSRGPVRATDPREAFLLARTLQLYPWGPARGLRVVALNDKGEIDGTLGYWSEAREAQHGPF